jgi:hypothetical protein
MNYAFANKLAVPSRSSCDVGPDFCFWAPPRLLPWPPFRSPPRDPLRFRLLLPFPDATEGNTSEILILYTYLVRFFFKADLCLHAHVPAHAPY